MPRTVNGVIINGMTAVKIANRKSKAGNWFDADTLRFWGTKVYSNLYGSRYFVTGEDDFSGTRKLYSIRELCDDGTINTVAFQAYLDSGSAAKYAELRSSLR